MQSTSTKYKFFKEIDFKSLTNWSTYFLLGHQLSYTQNYPLVRIGDFLKRNKKNINIEDHILYKRATIKLYNGGISLRDKEIGKRIGTKKQFVIKKRQFLLSKIDARNGAFGVVPDELDDAIITGNFWTFDVDYSKVNPFYLSILTGTKKFQSLCQAASVGTTNRHYLKESIFLDFKIPLPSIDEQKIILDRYNQKNALADQQKLDASNIDKEIFKFLFAELGLTIDKYTHEKSKLHFVNFKDVSFWGIDKILGISTFKSTKYPTVNLEHIPTLVVMASRGKSPKYDENGTYTILNQKCNRWNQIELEYSKKVNDKWFKSLNPNLFTKEGDILINSTGEGTIGRSSLVTREFENLMYDSHLLLLRVNKTEINPEYLVYLINSQYGQKQIEDLKSAKSTKQTELGIQNLLKIFFPLPEKKVQDNIVNYIKDQKQKAIDLAIEANKNTSASINEFESSIFKS